MDVALAINVERVENDALVTNAARAGDVALHQGEGVFGILTAHLGGDAPQLTNGGLVVGAPLTTSNVHVERDNILNIHATVANTIENHLIGLTSYFR